MTRRHGEELTEAFWRLTVRVLAEQKKALFGYTVIINWDR